MAYVVKMENVRLGAVGELGQGDTGSGANEPVRVADRFAYQRQVGSEFVGEQRGAVLRHDGQHDKAALAFARILAVHEIRTCRHQRYKCMLGRHVLYQALQHLWGKQKRAAPDTSGRVRCDCEHTHIHTHTRKSRSRSRRIWRLP